VIEEADAGQILTFACDVSSHCDLGQIVKFKVAALPTSNPTGEPTSSPSGEPTSSPMEPTSIPTGEPTISLTGEPTSSPTGEPTSSPTGEPTSSPTGEPTSIPTGEPTISPTGEPTISLTGEPTISPYLCEGSTEQEVSLFDMIRLDPSYPTNCNTSECEDAKYAIMVKVCLRIDGMARVYAPHTSTCDTDTDTSDWTGCFADTCTQDDLQRFFDRDDDGCTTSIESFSLSKRPKTLKSKKVPKNTKKVNKKSPKVTKKVYKSKKIH